MNTRTLLSLIVVLILVVGANAASRTPGNRPKLYTELSAAEAACLVRAYPLLEARLREEQNDGGVPPEVIYLIGPLETPCAVEVAPAGSGKGGGTVVRFLPDGGHEMKGTK